MSRGDDDSFLTRWQRRKDAVAEEERQTAEVPEPAQEPDDRSDAEILEELGLDHPETLEKEEDIRTFLAAAVPEHLRRIALRKLWRSNPILANVDGLVDYGGDYTDAANVVENMQTVYQVGKGMLRKVEEAVEALTGEADVEDEAEPEEAGEAVAEVSEETPEIEMLEEEPPRAAPPPVESAELTGDLPSGPVRRRMRFHIPEGQ